jgi:Polyketide cyclase / dehydrase and lipid transport
MPRHRVSARARISAPPALVYNIIADYHQHHPRILPGAFSNLRVKEGGIGAGTVITFDLRVAGQTKHYTGVVTEPKPGRHLVESYPSENGATSFEVEPDDGGCTLTIATEFDVREGIAGRIERWMSGLILRRLYADELRRIDEYARRQTGDHG